MANVKTDINDVVGSAHPHIRRIGPADLRDVLAKGLDDFMAMPTFSIFLVIIYPIIGLILFWLTFGHDMLQLVFPLIVGFGLIGPLAAIGLYDLSRRRERGLGVSPEALKDIHLPCVRAITILGIVMMAILFAWLGTAMLIYERTFGNWTPASIAEFARQIFTTPSGWMLIAAGCGAGLLFGIVAFTISVVSAPLLFDRDVGFATAVMTSIRAVLASPAAMAIWGLIVAGALMIGSLPFLVGLAVVFPILGHSTWHLYRAVVEP